eukprot:s59_g26.t1
MGCSFEWENEARELLNHQFTDHISTQNGYLENDDEHVGVANVPKKWIWNVPDDSTMNSMGIIRMRLTEDMMCCPHGTPLLCLAEMAEWNRLATVRPNGLIEKCTGWKDWRHNCYDPEGTYKKKFVCNDCSSTSPKWDVVIQPAGYCVELEVEEKETGLPFWKGKCEVRDNQRRAEAVAEYFLGDSVKNSHWLVDKAAMDASPACASKDSSVPNQCTPNPDGGPYCTRLFGGVCSSCYIPNTDPPYLDPTSQPMCPWDVLKEKGNAAAKPVQTKCASADPLSLCCLYGIGACGNVTGTDGSDAELTVKGFLLVTRMQDNKEMVKFAQRYVESFKGAVVDQAAFSSDIYSTWHYQPPTFPEQAGSAWDDFASTANQSSGVSWNPAKPTPKPSPGGGLTWLWIVIVVVVLALLGFAAFKYRQSQQARQPLLPSGQNPHDRGYKVASLISSVAPIAWHIGHRAIAKDGCLNFIDENDEVLVSGFGRRGHAVGDIPGVRFKVVKVAGCGLGALYRNKKEPV